MPRSRILTKSCRNVVVSPAPPLEVVLLLPPDPPEALSTTLIYKRAKITTLLWLTTSTTYACKRNDSWSKYGLPVKRLRLSNVAWIKKDTGTSGLRKREAVSVRARLLTVCDHFDQVTGWYHDHAQWTEFSWWVGVGRDVSAAHGDGPSKYGSCEKAGVT